jgi:RNA polymerase sigma-70 factor (ECF subfamily)
MQATMDILSTSDWERLYRLSEARPIGLRFETFCEALQAVAEKYLPGNATRSQQKAFYEKLHLQDWTLAQACGRGSVVAWERFLQSFRSRLYTAALVLVRDEQRARELVDSLAGDLFVTQHSPTGGTCSKLASYSGRGSLEGWLKALLANTYLDQYRSATRVVSLEQRTDLLKTLCIRQDTGPREPDPRLNHAIQQSFCQCDPQERFLLVAYFFDRWTLQELATTLGVHESSVSRRLDRLLRALRRRIHRYLERTGMSARQMEELRTEGWNVSVDVRGLLLRGWAGE